MKPFKESDVLVHDLQSAYDYYKAYGTRAAEDFLAAYQESIALIIHHPFVARSRRHGWRQMIIRRHASYSIFYKELPAVWLIGGIVSTLRDPDTIQAQLLIREAGED